MLAGSPKAIRYTEGVEESLFLRRSDCDRLDCVLGVSTFALSASF